MKTQLFILVTYTSLLKQEKELEIIKAVQATVEVNFLGEIFSCQENSRVVNVVSDMK